MSFNIRSSMRPHLKDLEPYVPIVPLEVLSRDLGVSVDRIVKLDGNENPYGPSPKVREALAAFDAYHIYPDPLQRDLRSALVGYTGLGEEHIVVGNGSDELIDLVMRLFLEPGDKVINCTPTFGMYSFNTQVCGGEVVDVPRGEGYQLDISAIKDAMDRRTKLIFLASPNNPTGNPASAKEIEALLDMGLLVVVDEAYYEFCGASVASLVREHDNLVVLRTFSKWAGLAGLRVGYGLFPPEIVSLVDRIKPPYNVNMAGLVAAEASLKDTEFLRSRVQAIIEERERLYRVLSEFSFLLPIPSQANFILCLVDGVNALDVKRSLERDGILVKHIDTRGVPNAIRISVGLPQHTDIISEALGKWSKR